MFLFVSSISRYFCRGVGDIVQNGPGANVGGGGVGSALGEGLGVLGVAQI